MKCCSCTIYHCIYVIALARDVEEVQENDDSPLAQFQVSLQISPQMRDYLKRPRAIKIIVFPLGLSCDIQYVRNILAYSRKRAKYRNTKKGSVKSTLRYTATNKIKINHKLNKIKLLYLLFRRLSRRCSYFAIRVPLSLWHILLTYLCHSTR